MRAQIATSGVLVGLALSVHVATAGCFPPPAGLAAWWRFEGNLVDSVGNADLSIVPSTAAPYGAGKVGARGLDFGACAGACVIETPNPFDFSTTSFSIDLWVKPDPSWPDGQVGWLLDKRDASTADEVGFTLYLRPMSSTNNYVQLELRAIGGVTPTWQWYYGPLFDGNWHLLTITVERGPDQIRGRLFVDDQEMPYLAGGGSSGNGSGPFTGDIDTGAPIRVGRLVCTTGCGGIFMGNIDELEIFDRALTVPEVRAIHAADTDGKCFCGDHLKCYKIRDPQKFIATVDLESRFGMEPGCQLKAPAVEYCVPVSKKVTSQTPTLPVVGDCLTQEQLCYRLRCDPPVPAATRVKDQFADRVVTPRKAVQLCTPIPRPILTTTTTSSSTSSTAISTTSTTETTETSTTTTTSLPPPWPPCSDPSVTSPQCDGACPPGMMCVDPGGGTCSCAPAGGMGCGAAQGPPQCWGDCPLDDETGLEQVCKQRFRCSVSLDKCIPGIQPCPLPQDSCDPLCTCFPPEPIE